MISEETLRVGIPVHWGTTLPPLQHSAYGAAVQDNQFEALVRRGKNGIIEPLAARSWEVSRDRRIFRFRIDTARRFSDGTGLVASDFKRSWEEGLRMESQSSNKSTADVLCAVKGYSDFTRTRALAGVRAPSDELLEVEFSEPLRVALEHLAGVRFAAFKIREGRAIGTGPYVMDESKDSLLLSPNPHHPGRERLFRKVVIQVAGERQLRSGRVDAMLFAERLNLPECAGPARGAIRCVQGQEAAHYVVSVNGLRGRFFSDREHRLALQTLIHDALRQSGPPEELRANRFLPDAQSFLRFQAGRLPDQEAEALVDAGRKHIARLIAASRTKPLYLASGQDCEWLIALLRRRGLGLAKKSGALPFPRILRMLYKSHEPDLIFGSFSVENGDPDGLYHLLGRNGAIHSPMLDRAAVAEAMEIGRGITDQRRIAPQYMKASRAILREVPYVHLGYTYSAVAYDSRRLKLADSFVNRNNPRVTVFNPR